MNSLWITWEHHRRTIELAAALTDVRLHEIPLNANRWVRYLRLLWRTFLLLIKNRPDVTIAQSPSVVLAFFMVTAGRHWTPRVIIDAHNEGLRPFHTKYNFLLPLYRLMQCRADLVIVTNAALKDEVALNGGRPFVLEDKIPDFGHSQRIPLQGRRNVVLVCTFEKDEPYQEVIEAARFLEPETYVYLTGRHDKAPPEIIAGAPANVHFTGFLPDQDYLNLLYSCDVIIDLTLMQDCLVCGAYEAVALEKPMVLSRTRALMDYFDAGAVYTRNQASDIAAAIQTAIDKRELLGEEVRRLKHRRQIEWQGKLERLDMILASLRNSSRPS